MMSRYSFLDASTTKLHGGLFIGVFWFSSANALSEGDVGAACPIWDNSRCRKKTLR